MRVVVVIVPRFFFVDWAVETTRTSASIPVAFYAQPHYIAVLVSSAFAAEMACQGKVWEAAQHDKLQAAQLCCSSNIRMELLQVRVMRHLTVI
jgi:hypothetical protein